MLVLDLAAVEPGKDIALDIGYRLVGHLRWQALRVHLEQDRESLSEFPLQMLARAQALELAIHHNAQAIAKCLTFLHAV